MQGRENLFLRHCQSVWDETEQPPFQLLLKRVLKYLVRGQCSYFSVPSDGTRWLLLRRNFHLFPWRSSTSLDRSISTFTHRGSSWKVVSWCVVTLAEGGQEWRSISSCNSFNIEGRSMETQCGQDSRPFGVYLTDYKKPTPSPSSLPFPVPPFDSITSLFPLLEFPGNSVLV